MKIDPIPSDRPTVRDVARGFNQLHGCLEDLKERAATKEDLIPIKSEVGRLTETLLDKRTMATSTPMSSFWRTFGAVGASIASIVVVAKLVIIIGPFAKDIAVALWHAVETGKL